MATMDFLLRPATPAPRAQTSGQDNATNQRSTAPALTQSFSAVYEQQRSAKANQQQVQQAKQRNDAVQQEKQQQAARQTPVKNTTPPVKDKPAGTVKQPLDAKNTRAEPHEKTADAAPRPVRDENAVPNPVHDEDAVEQGGKVLPSETAEQVESVEDEFLDPLLLMAMTSIPAEQEADEGIEPDVGLLASQAAAIAGSLGQTAYTKSNLESSVELEESEGLLTEEDGLTLQKKTDKIDTSVTPEKAALLTTTSGKTAEVLLEKGFADKNNSAALLEAAKTAPDTLLNTKAVTPTDTIRADMQPRSESLLGAQQTRQVPGAAIAMQQPGWTQQVTDKVMWMSSQNLKSAEIKLDPAELGRLDIKVDMSQEHTQVTFTSANAGVRESLEAQMHRLRELLAQQGMPDVDVNVSDQSQQHANAQAHELAQGRGGAGTGADNGEEIDHHVTPLPEQHDGRLGLVDYYA